MFPQTVRIPFSAQRRNLRQQRQTPAARPVERIPSEGIVFRQQRLAKGLPIVYPQPFALLRRTQQSHQICGASSLARRRPCVGGVR